MKKISKRLFNYHSTKKNKENIDIKKDAIALKKENEENIEDIYEKVQDTEQTFDVNEQEDTAPNNKIRISQYSAPLEYQNHERNLEFGIIQCSSNYGEFSPYELSVNDIDKNYKSWISSKNCQFPQYVTLKLTNGANYINTLQILFHQLFIPSKVEIFLGNCVKIPSIENDIKNYEKLVKSYVAVEFDRIGYFTLYNNQEKNNTARELKSIKINKKAQYIKLVIYENYENEANIDNQVGIVSVKVNGTPLPIESDDDDDDYSEKSIEDDIQNKVNKNSKVTSNTTLKKSENITKKQKYVPSNGMSVDNDIGLNINKNYDKYNSDEDTNLINGNVISNKKVNNKISKEDFESQGNNDKNSSEDDDYDNSKRRKNIKPNNLTMVTNNINDNINSPSKNIKRRPNSLIQKNNIIQDVEDIVDGYDNSEDSLSSVMSVSILSTSNIVNANSIAERKRLNNIPSLNENVNNNKINNYSNINNNNNNNNNKINNNYSNINNNNNNNNNKINNNYLNNNNNNSNNNIKNSNSHNNNSNNNNNSNSIMKSNNSNIYDEFDNELNQMIHNSSLELHRDEQRNKRQNKKDNENSVRENQMSNSKTFFKTEKGNIINEFDQTKKYNARNILKSDIYKTKDKQYKKTELGMYINALENAKRKAIRSGKNEFTKVINTLLIIFNESQNKINKMSDLRIQAMKDENIDESENIKANIDYIKDIAINNLKKNSELIVEQSPDTQEIYIYENEEFENELEEERSFSINSSHQRFSYSNMDGGQINNRSRSSISKSGTSSKKGSFHDLMSKGKGPYEENEYGSNHKFSDESINRNSVGSRESRNLMMLSNSGSNDKQNMKDTEENNSYDNDIPDEKKLEPLHKNVINDYGLSISIFSEFVIRSLFSLRFQYKEWAIKHILYQLKINYDKWNNGTTKKSNSDVKKSTQEEYIMASIQVLKYSILDSREKIISISMDLLLLISSIVKSHDLSPLLFNEMDFLTSQIFIKSADINKRIKECALNTFMKMAFFFHSKPYSILPYIFRPFNISIKTPSKKELRINDNDSVLLIPWRYAVSRLQLLLDIIKKYGISSMNDTKRSSEDNGLTFDNVMKFVIPFFNHQNGKVRNIASSLIAEISVEVDQNNNEFNEYIKDLNPQILNIIKMKSNLLKSEKNDSIYDAYLKEKERNKNSTLDLDQDNDASSILNYSYYQNINNNENIIGEYDDTTEELSKIHEKAKNDEINNVNKSFSYKMHSEPTSYLETSMMNRSERNDEVSVSYIENSESYLETLNRNHICIFCEEKNEEFNEKTLDQHYRKECPMLVNCYRCQLIVEASNLSSHLYHDCEFKSEYKKCDKCNLAIRYDDREKHNTFHKNNRYEESLNGFKAIRCQLCNEIINSSISKYYNKLDKRNRNRNSLMILENKMWKSHMLKCQNNARNRNIKK